MFNLKSGVLCIACSLCFTVVAHESNRCDDQEISDQASSRIPPLCIQGTTNQKFRWTPSIGEVALYTYTHDIRPWMTKHFYPTVTHYMPSVIKYVIMYEKDKNAVILAIPIVLKTLKKL